MKKYLSILIVSIFLIIFGFFIFNYSKNYSDQLESEVYKLNRNLTPGIIEILNPTFKNKGINSNPYEINALKGIQINEDIELHTVNGKFTDKNQKLIFVSADKAYYSQNDQIIELVGNVLVYDDFGNKTSTDKAVIDIEIEKTTLTNRVISVTSTSQIKSNSSIVDEKNGIITYAGNVKARIRSE